VQQYTSEFAGSGFAGAMAFRVDRAGGIAKAAQIAHPALERFGALTYDRAVVMGSRLLLISTNGVLATFTGAPGPGQFVAYGG
jgi:hypothetical protein